MNDKQKIIKIFMDIQNKIANTYDSMDVDSDIEDLFDYIVSAVDKGAEIVMSMELLED